MMTIFKNICTKYLINMNTNGKKKHVFIKTELISVQVAFVF